MIESVLALVVATSFLLGSPGPAPLALAATSATFGVKNSLPFYFGILLGLCVVIIGSILGLSAILSSYPNISLFIKVLGASYLVYIAYKIGTAPVVPKDSEQKSNRPTVIDGFIFNILNPKAYAAFFAIFAQFLLPASSINTSYVITAMISFSLAIVIDFIWVLLGSTLKIYFETEQSARRIRIGFAVLIVAVILFGLFY